MSFVDIVDVDMNKILIIMLIILIMSIIISVMRDQ